MLRRNAPHFVQYVLARYFHADSGSEQLSWMLPNFSASKMLTSGSPSDLRRYSFVDLNDTLELMVGQAPALHDLMNQMNQRVGGNAKAASLLPEDNCMVALACLYSSNSFSSLYEPDKVKVRIRNSVL